MHRKPGPRGMITIVTLWTLAILSVLALGLSYRTAIDLKIETYNMEQVQARALARSGVYRAVAELMQDQSRGPVDHLGESWNDDRRAFQDIRLGAGEYRVGYLKGNDAPGPPPDVGVGGPAERDWIFGIIDEERKISVQHATLEALTFLSERGVDLPLQEASILPVEGRVLSPDMFPQLFPSNLFSGDVVPERLALARKYLTAYGDGRVNINTASREVLSVLGMPGSLVDRILSYRSGPDHLEGTVDDTSFVSLESIPAVFRQLGELSPQESADLSYFIRTDVLTVSSHFFRIEAIGYVDDRRVARKVTAIVERTDEGKAVVRSWIES